MNDYRTINAASGPSPLYSPELNPVEIRWHRCQHYWVRPEDYTSDQTRLDRLECMLRYVEKLHNCF